MIIGVVVAKYGIIVTFGFVSDLRISDVLIGIGIGEGVITKRKLVVIFGLVSDLRISKWSMIIGVVIMKCGTVVYEMRNCRHFWICLGSSYLKNVNKYRDRGKHIYET